MKNPLRVTSVCLKEQALFLYDTARAMCFPAYKEAIMRKKIFTALFAVIIIAAMALVLMHDTDGGTAGKKSLPSGSKKAAEVEDSVLSEKKFEKKRQAAAEKEAETAFSSDLLLWDGGEAAVDAASATVYIPYCTDAGVTWQEVLGRLTPADHKSRIWYAADQAMDTLSDAVEEGHAFRALLDTEGEILEFNVVLTGLPTLCIHKLDPEEIVRKENHTGRITLVSPLGSEGLQGARKLNCSFHVRGNVTSLLKKKPYKISLTDLRGGNYKAGLLDLRTDDDWILNPLFSDETRVREATAYALWERTGELSDNPVPSSRIRYTEFFLDDSYQGIYGLMEPVDKKQLNLSEGDLLYKIDRWNDEYPYIDLYDEAEEGQDLEILNDKGFTCVEIRYPLQWDRTATWKPMQAFHEFCFKNGDPAALNEAGLHIDRKNMAEMSLFCAMTHAMDNNWKNTFLVCRRRPDTGYDLFRTIWDLNYVFGDVFLYDPENKFNYFDYFTADAYQPGKDSSWDFEAFLAEDPSMRDILCDQWKEWRKGGISADYVCAAARSNYDTLRRSGALAREMERWPQENTPEEAVERMEDWIARRFDFLDSCLK